MSNKTLTITDNRTGKTFDFEIKDGSCGPAVADLTSFYDKTGMFVYDPGFKSTSVKEIKKYDRAIFLKKYIEFIKSLKKSDLT